MRTSLRAAGKEAKGIFVFTVGTTILEEEWPLEKLGITEGSSIEVTVLDSMRPLLWMGCLRCVLWQRDFWTMDQPSNGVKWRHTPMECERLFHCLETQSVTYALRVLTLAPMLPWALAPATAKWPREAMYISMVRMRIPGRCVLENSGEIVACHKGEVCVMQNSKGEQLEAPPRTNFPHMSHSHMSQPYAVHQLFDLSSWGKWG